MELIFFAALALYIFLRLFKEFGKINEDEKRNLEEIVAKKKEKMQEVQQQMIEKAKQQIAQAISTQAKIEEEILSSIDHNNREIFLSIIQRSNITAEFFLNGAKSVFEMVLKSFAEGNLAELKTLLSEKIYQGFEGAVNQRNAENKKMVTNLIAIDDAKIISAQITDNLALVTVSFSSRQINYLLNQTDEIIEGRKDEIAQVHDTWTFKRDLNSTSPNWVVNATLN